MIQIDELGFTYTGQPVLHELSFEIRRGEILSILGPNGCGKSTLLKLLRGVLMPGRGRILWEGRQADRFSRKAMARMAAIVPQSLPLPFPYPVREMVMMGRFAHQRGLTGPSSADHRAVERALAVTDTLHLFDRPVTDLSGGELQRVLLARALAQQTSVLLLDEATSHLDLNHRLEIAELLLRLNREEKLTVIQISHDLDLAAETSKRILLLRGDGRAAAIGTPTEVFTPDNLRQVFQVEVKVESNPYTGAPRAYPIGRGKSWQEKPPRVHLLCGGGSGGELLRRLHLAGGKVTVGPLNRGDSDQVLALALEVDTVLEESFCPISPATLQLAMSACRQAEALVIAPTVWGPGNLACLDLAQEALRLGRPVFLVDPRPGRDYTGGKAWERLQFLLQAGAQQVPDTAAVLALLKDKSAAATGR